jgi:hypothetical protein
MRGQDWVRERSYLARSDRRGSTSRRPDAPVRRSAEVIWAFAGVICWLGATARTKLSSCSDAPDQGRQVPSVREPYRPGEGASDKVIERW